MTSLPTPPDFPPPTLSTISYTMCVRDPGMCVAMVTGMCIAMVKVNVGDLCNEISVIYNPTLRLTAAIPLKHKQPEKPTTP